MDFLISDFGLNPQSALRSKMHFTMHRLGGFGFYILIGNGPRECPGMFHAEASTGNAAKTRSTRDAIRARFQLMLYPMNKGQKKHSGQPAMNRSTQGPVQQPKIRRVLYVSAFY